MPFIPPCSHVHNEKNPFHVTICRTKRTRSKTLSLSLSRILFASIPSPASFHRNAINANLRFLIHEVGKEYRWRTRGNVRMDVRSLSRWRALNERTAFPAASLHRSPLVGRATVTSTTSLMLRTIALAGVHDGKSISFRVSLSGSWHETKFRATRKRRHRERGGERETIRKGVGEGILCLGAQITRGQEEERCSCSIRGHTEQEE